MKPLALLLALLISFVCVSVQAAPVVRIRQQVCNNGSCSYTYRSGTIIGRDDRTRKLVVLTCAHQWERAPVVVEIDPQHGYEEGQLVAFDNDDDVAIILVNHTEKVKFIPIAEKPPAVGEPVRISGFAGNDYRVVDGKVGKYEHSPKGTEYLLVDDVTLSQGQSGGSAINSDYEVVGTLTGNTTQTTTRRRQGFFCSCTRIRQIIKQALGSIPPRPIKGTFSSPKNSGVPAPADPDPSPNIEAPAPEPPALSAPAKAKEIFISDLPGFKQLLKSELGPLKDEVIAAVEKKKGPLSKAELDAILKPHVKQAASDAGVLATKNIKAAIAHEILPKLGLPAAVEFGGPALLKLLGVVGLGVTGPVGIGLGIGSWMLSRHMKGINAGLLALHNRIHHTTPNQPTSPPNGPTQTGADQTILSDDAQIESGMVQVTGSMQPRTKYVQVQVADPLGEAMSQMLDKETEMNSAFAPIAARVKHNAAFIVRQSKGLLPTSPFPQLS